MTFKDFGDIVIYLGMLAAALTGIGSLMYFIAYRPLMKKLREELIPQTAKIHSEITPNHGSSMKDQVTRTEVKLTALEQRFSDHIQTHANMK